jgi:hypothetical protein
VNNAAIYSGRVRKLWNVNVLGPLRLSTGPTRAQ